jgi:hypothetical protein
VSIQIQVLLAVIIVDVIVLAFTWRSIAFLTPEGRARLPKNLLLVFIFSGAVAVYSAYNLYLWYSSGELQYATRFSGHVITITITEQPYLFTGAAVLWSLGLLIFGAGTMWILAEWINRIRHNSN